MFCSCSCCAMASNFAPCELLPRRGPNAGAGPDEPIEFTDIVFLLTQRCPPPALCRRQTFAAHGGNLLPLTNFTPEASHHAFEHVTNPHAWPLITPDAPASAVANAASHP